MARLIRKHADSGALAGFGLLAITASVLLALSLGSAGVSLQAHATPDPLQMLQSLLGAIRVGG
jgi:hypothetical protein